MLSDKEINILECIIEFCKRIEEKTADVSKEFFETDKDIQDIVCFNVMQIGEVANKLPKAFIEKYDKQPWTDIIGMRHVIVHAYGLVEQKDMWKCATDEIKPLREYCENILKQ